MTFTSGSNGISASIKLDTTGNCNTLFTTAVNGSQPDTTTLFEDYVFIGPRAIILPGITLGKGAVVGAGAVRTSMIKVNSGGFFAKVGNSGIVACHLFAISKNI